jgi:hypothetical protein
MSAYKSFVLHLEVSVYKSCVLQLWVCFCAALEGWLSTIACAAVLVYLQ